MVNYSIIIPQKNSLRTLPRLLESIPNRTDIEIIVVDNSEIPIKRSDIRTNRSFLLYHANHNRYAGGARNVGIENANGIWIIFADADDFFTPEAFSAFDKYIDSDADLVYFKANAIYEESGEPSDRGRFITASVTKYLNGELNEMKARLSNLSPVCKMIKLNFINKYKIRFDEVIAANDTMFSTYSGYYAERFYVEDQFVYTITTSKGTLLFRRDVPAMRSRYLVTLERNKFLKEHHLSNEQGSVMRYLLFSAKCGVKTFWDFLLLSIKYRQNIFIGYLNWINTFFYYQTQKKKNKSLITK